MARHAEVSEEVIIQAGKELESAGKKPNPGAIRAHLGYRGGLVRIKAIWDSYVKQRNESLMPELTQELNLDALPDEYAQNVSVLMTRVSEALEHLAIEVYLNGQSLFEKRLNVIEQSHEEKLGYYQEYELSADDSIKRLEVEVDESQREVQALADQNAKLLLENSELKGRLSAIEDGLVSESKA